MTQTQKNILAMLRNASRKTTPTGARTDPAKASVLASTHRPPTVPETPAVHVGDIELIQRLKEAAK